MNQPKERPILFKGEMVRAIIDGRKTQTRRFMKPQPEKNGAFWEWAGAGWSLDHGPVPVVPGHSMAARSPYGMPGDRLWVRETFQGPLVSHEQAEEYYADSKKFHSPDYCQYRADGGPSPVYLDADDEERYGWKPSIFMPRWASRITLEITDVRVERLQDISQSDAIAEGAPESHPSIDTISRELGYQDFSRSWFAQLWQSINVAESWEANPWVWVVEFKRVEPSQ